MTINSMLVYHLVHPDLGVNFEIGGVDFKIGDWGTCFTLVLGFEEHFIQGLSAFALLSSDKKSSWKLSWPLLPSLDYWLLLICLASVQNWGKDMHWGFCRCV